MIDWDTRRDKPGIFKSQVNCIWYSSPRSTPPVEGQPLEYWENKWLLFQHPKLNWAFMWNKAFTNTIWIAFSGAEPSKLYSVLFSSKLAFQGAQIRFELFQLAFFEALGSFIYCQHIKIDSPENVLLSSLALSQAYSGWTKNRHWSWRDYSWPRLPETGGTEWDSSFKKLYK